MSLSSFTNRTKPKHILFSSIILGVINLLINLLPVSDRALEVFNAVFGMTFAILVTSFLLILYRVSHYQQYSFSRTILWLLITMSGWLTGDFFYLMNILMNVDPFLSISDVFYILSTLLLIVALLSISGTQPVSRKIRMVIIEMSILVLSAAAIFAMLLFSPGNPYLDYDVPSLMLMFAYPVMDILLIWVVMILLFTHSTKSTRKVLGLLLLAIVFLFLSDSIYLINNLYNSIFPDYLADMGYYLYYVMLLLSGLAGFREIRELPTEREKSIAIFRPNNWIVFLPGIFIIAVIGFLITFALSNSLALFHGIIVLIVIIIILYVIHQYLVIDDNIKLGKEMLKINSILESKVDQRTQELSKINTDLLAEINEREKAELNLAKSNEELARLNKDKDRFFTILAHDLRSPVGSIMKLSELIVDNFNDFDQTELLEIVKTIKKSSTHTFELLNDLLSWSAVQMGKAISEQEVFLLANTVSEINSMMSADATAKEIKIKMDIDPSIAVYADNFAIQTVLRNLVSNAIKFTKHHGVIIVNAEQKGEFVKISVIDNGVGIAKDKQVRIFKVDELNSANGTDGEKGTGFGLLLSKDLVERNGGEIGFESEKGKGSVFYFTLPVPKDSDVSALNENLNSITYNFDQDKQLGFTTITGKVNSKDLETGIKRIWGSGNFNSEYPVIIDMRQADLVIDINELSDFAGIFIERPGDNTNKKLAFLTSSPQHVALSSILSNQLIKKYSLNIEIFSTYEACLAWLKG